MECFLYLVVDSTGAQLNLYLMTTPPCKLGREDYIVPAMQSNAVYESRYLMGTSLARPCIAKGAMQAAVDYGCGALAHGATGKGNDQVRFELSFYALAPRINVVAPWRNQEFLDKFQGRNDMLAYAKEKGIPIEGHGQAKPFSMDDVSFVGCQHMALKQ